MNVINESFVLETIDMIRLYNLDIRTVTLALSLRDCINDDVDRLCENIHNKILKYAKNLVSYANDFENEYSIPICNKRISVTPISLIGEACKNYDYVKISKTLDDAAKEVGVDFVGGFSALVEKGFTRGDEALIEAIPESTCSKLTVENIYGRANENVECISRNITTKTGLIEMKLEMSAKFVNGINPIEMNVIV